MMIGGLRRLAEEAGGGRGAATGLEGAKARDGGGAGGLAGSIRGSESELEGVDVESTLLPSEKEGGEMKMCAKARAKPRTWEAGSNGADWE